MFPTAFSRFLDILDVMELGIDISAKRKRACAQQSILMYADHNGRKEIDMNENVLAKEIFHVYGKTIGGRVYDSIVIATLEKSDAFQYGNHTCMIWKWPSGEVQSFDTRYERVSPKSFKDFAEKSLRKYCNSIIEIKCITDTVNEKELEVY